VAELTRLIEEDSPLAIPGIVFQELLSGVRTTDEFRRLEGLLEGFPLLEATRADHRAAAQISNSSRRKGIAAATVDCLIAAQCIGVAGQLFTLDRDFEALAPHCDLKLHRLETRPESSL
jgi:predicted nucleic acid-binding protein